MKILLLTLLLLTSCGKVINDVLVKDNEPDHHETHPDFYPYIDLFEKYYGQIKTPIIYGNAKDNQSWVGVCTKWSNSNYTEITIDKEYWDNASETAREQLILHELGHCEFNKGHNDKRMYDCPESVMTTYVFSYYELTNCFEPNFKYYIDKLLE